MKEISLSEMADYFMGNYPPAHNNDKLWAMCITAV